MLAAIEQTTLLNAVKEALQCWQKPAAAGALRHLQCWRTLRDSQTDLERTKKLLVTGLETLRAETPELTEILYKLYIEEYTVGEVANQLAMSEPTVNRRKKEAVDGADYHPGEPGTRSASATLVAF